MGRFLKIFLSLTAISYVLYFGYNYYQNKTNYNQGDEDKTNIENIVKNENNSQEDIEGTVVAKRSTENNSNNNNNNNNSTNKDNKNTNNENKNTNGDNNTNSENSTNENNKN